MRGRVALMAAAALASAVSIAAAQSDDVLPLTVTIDAPADGSYVSGPTPLVARVTPFDGSVTVRFYADGKEVCVLQKAPYECGWDAGPLVKQHQIRAVATRGTTRVVKTVSTKDVGYAESVNVDVVQITAAVTSGRGKYVKGLARQAFRVFEDGQPQTISHFAAEGVPLELVVALDTSSSMTEAMPSLKAAVKAFLSALSPRDRVAVLGFNDNIFTVIGKTNAPMERVDAIDGLSAAGFTSLYDVILHGVDLLGRETGRKALVVFTDGEDQGSHGTIEDAERALQSSDATLYMIGEGRGASMERLKKVMQRLVDTTGGQALFADKPSELRQRFGELLTDLSNQYLLGYAPTNARHDGTLRHIRVEVDGRYDVRARQAYRAPAGK